MNTNTQVKEEPEATPAEVEQEDTQNTANEDALEGLSDQEDEIEDDPDESVEDEPEEEPEEESDEESDEEESEEEPEEEEPKEKAKPISKEEFLTQAKEAFPDKKIESEEDAYVELLNYQKENDAANQRVMQVLTGAPQLMEIIKELDSGASFVEALALHVDLDDIIPQEGEPDREAFKKAKEKRIKQAKEIQDLRNTIENNLATSTKTLEKFRTEKKMSEEEVSNFTTAAHQVIKDVQDGLITDQFLDFMFKGLKWEAALEESRKQGEIKGKNKNIKAQKVKSGDNLPGLPNITSQGQPENSRKDPLAVELVKYQSNRQRF